MNTLVEDLDLLHAQYVALINHAIDADDTAAADELAVAYDDDAIRMMAEREGKTHLLPLVRRTTAVDSRLRRLVARLGLGSAA
jgi:hypothetical protein